MHKDQNVINWKMKMKAIPIRHMKMNMESTMKLKLTVVHSVSLKILNLLNKLLNKLMMLTVSTTSTS